MLETLDTRCATPTPEFPPAHVASTHTIFFNPPSIPDGLHTKGARADVHYARLDDAFDIACLVLFVIFCTHIARMISGNSSIGVDSTGKAQTSHPVHVRYV